MPKQIELTVSETVVYSFKIDVNDLFEWEDMPLVINPDSVEAIEEWLSEDVDRQVIADQCTDENFDYCEDRSLDSATAVAVEASVAA
jgi:hypothetical protein